MRALITGGAGFIGSHLTDYLVRNGADVHVLDNLSSGTIDNVNRSATLHRLDIRDEETTSLLLNLQPDYVFHLAAQINVQHSIAAPSFDASINVGGTLRLLEACRKADTKKLIFSSTSAIYGDHPADLVPEEAAASPLSFYGLSKSAAESYIRLYSEMTGLNYSILRYSNVYGPRQLAVGEGGVVAIFLHRIQRNLPLTMHGDGEQTRDFIFVQDIVKANAACLRLGNKQTFNISTGKTTSIRELAQLLEQIHGSPIAVHYSEKRPGDIRNSCLDRSKAGHILEWTPLFSISQGLEETYRSSLK